MELSVCTYNIVYRNDKKLGIYDFIEEIKEDLIKGLLKSREFIPIFSSFGDYIFEDSILVEVLYYNKNNISCKSVIGFLKDKDFGVNGICARDFVKELLENANKDYIPENELLDIDDQEIYDSLYRNGVYMFL